VIAEEHGILNNFAQFKEQLREEQYTLAKSTHQANVNTKKFTQALEVVMGKLMESQEQLEAQEAATDAALEKVRVKMLRLGTHGKSNTINLPELDEIDKGKTKKKSDKS